MSTPMPLFAGFLISFCTLLTLAASAADRGGSARFEGKETLLRPKNYREWVFVGTSLGLRYDKDPATPTAKSSPQFNTVYINPAAYRSFSRTGRFPEGTVLMLELASAETKSEPGLQGSYQKEFTALEAAVKDSKRFADGWAYFSFDGDKGTRKDKATPFARSACFDCHRTKAATDNVFTQFYPALRSRRPGP